MDLPADEIQTADLMRALASPGVPRSESAEPPPIGHEPDGVAARIRSRIGVERSAWRRHDDRRPPAD
ncbi:MAG: hypothetical protein OXG83_08365 [Acidobacteria bacterium]|nr:hypothetical protein [Acidobacteriota bacterium]